MKRYARGFSAVRAMSLAGGPESYRGFMALMGSPLGRLVMFGLTVAILFHLANGIRHLIWDLGHSLEIKSANSSSITILAFTAVATVVVWILALNTGALG